MIPADDTTRPRPGTVGPDGPTVDFDRAATTPLRPEARAAMAPFLAGRYGNPSSAHALGRDAMRAVDEAREQLADLLGCAPSELVFTSGGTEADVHAVTGGIPTRADRVVCSAVEHPAVLATVTALGGSTVAVHRDGRIDLDALAAELSLPGKVGLVSVMAANNEIGTLNDLAEV
ncbi:MAG TPA: aminotransferase class V-fold PLP-dependent enzyme, partial [Microthrixaceae bacterium]|nr:aminotransferase class V-fold PLP-dependent enzyme [Microthrixaceae bacterium]